MEISSETKRYILVIIAGAALAAYIVPTAGWLDLNAAFAGGYGGSGGSECEGGDGGDGGDGGTTIAKVNQVVEQTSSGGSDEYGNTAFVDQEANVDVSAD